MSKAIHKLPQFEVHAHGAQLPLMFTVPHDRAIVFFTMPGLPYFSCVAPTSNGGFKEEITPQKRKAIIHGNVSTTEAPYYATVYVTGDDVPDMVLSFGNTTSHDRVNRIVSNNQAEHRKSLVPSNLQLLSNLVSSHPGVFFVAACRDPYVSGMTAGTIKALQAHDLKARARMVHTSPRFRHEYSKLMQPNYRNANHVLKFGFEAFDHPGLKILHKLVSLGNTSDLVRYGFDVADNREALMRYINLKAQASSNQEHKRINSAYKKRARRKTQVK
jgi:hypothetical protein